MKKLLLFLALTLVGILASAQTLAPVYNPLSGLGLQWVNTDAGGSYQLSIARDTTFVRLDTIYEYTTGHGVLVDGLRIIDGVVTAGGYQGYPIGSAYIGDLTGTYEVQLNNEAGLYGVLADVAQFLEPGDDISLLDGTANRLFYTDGSGNLTALAFGTDDQILKMNGSTLNWEEDAGGGGTTTITDMEGTAWRVLYINGDGDVTELAPGADGTVLTSTGTTSAPAFESLSGSSGLTESEVADLVHDSLDALYSGAEIALYAKDSGVYDGGYITPTMLDDAIDGVETGTGYVAVGDSSGTALGSYTTGYDFYVLSQLVDSLKTVIANMDGGGDATAPTVSSAEIGAYSDSILLVLFSESLDTDSIPDETAFTFTGGATTIGLDSAWANADSLFIGLDSILTVFTDSTFLLDYALTDPALQDASGNKVYSFTDQAVTNNFSDYPAIFSNSDSTIGLYIADVDNYTLDSDTAVQQWDDLSGNGNHLTAANSGYRLWYNGGDSVMVTPGSRLAVDLGADSIDMPITVYAVFNQWEYIQWSSYLKMRGGDLGFSAFGSDPDIAIEDSEGNWSTEFSTLADSTWAVVTLILDGADTEIKINGVQAQTFPGFVDDYATQIQIGGSGTSMWKALAVMRGRNSTFNETAIYNYFYDKIY